MLVANSAASSASHFRPFSSRKPDTLWARPATEQHGPRNCATDVTCIRCLLAGMSVLPTADAEYLSMVVDLVRRCNLYAITQL